MYTYTIHQHSQVYSWCSYRQCILTTILEIYTPMHTNIFHVWNFINYHLLAHQNPLILAAHNYPLVHWVRDIDYSVA